MLRCYCCFPPAGLWPPLIASVQAPPATSGTSVISCGTWKRCARTLGRQQLFVVSGPARLVPNVNAIFALEVVSGNTPFLLSRPALEAWGAKQDFANGTMQVMNGEQFKPERGHRGHYVTDLINKDEIYMIEESPHDPWRIWVIFEPNALETNDEAFLEIDDYQALVADVVKRGSQSSKLLFLELYVDKGNLATTLAEQYGDVNVATFTLPELGCLQSCSSNSFSEALDT